MLSCPRGRLVHTPGQPSRRRFRYRTRYRPNIYHPLAALPYMSRNYVIIRTYLSYCRDPFRGEEPPLVLIKGGCYGGGVTDWADRYDRVYPKVAGNVVLRELHRRVLGDDYRALTLSAFALPCPTLSQ